MKKLIEKQEKLDEAILENIHVRTGLNIKPNQVLVHRFDALFTELGEFAEEHNYESKREEYIDCLHFILTIGLTLEFMRAFINYKFSEVYENAAAGEYEKDVIILLRQIAKLNNAVECHKYWKVERKIKHNAEKHYINMFMSFLNLGKTMGYEAAEIIGCYSEKNRINHARQEFNY